MREFLECSDGPGQQEVKSVSINNFGGEIFIKVNQMVFVLQERNTKSRKVLFMKEIQHV